jgi:hypothetical protein
VHVGGEDLHVDRAASRGELLVEHHRERVWFLAGRTPGDPQPQLLTRRHAIEDLRDDLALERLVRFRIAEELGHADEQILVERVELVGVRLQLLDVGRDAVDAQQVDAPLYPPRHRARLVEREVDAELIAQQAQRRVHRGVVAQRLGVLDRLERRQPAQDPREIPRHPSIVDDAGCLRAERHAVELRAGHALREHHAPGTLDVDDPARAIAAASRQHDRDGLRPLVLCERTEELVDREREALRRILVGQDQPAIANDHLLARRHQVDVVCLDQHAILGEPHRHVAVPGDQLVHQAPEIRRQMLHDHEGHPGVGRHLREQLLERFEPAGRGPDADDPRGCGREQLARGSRRVSIHVELEVFHRCSVLCANHANRLSIRVHGARRTVRYRPVAIRESDTRVAARSPCA